MSKNIEIEKEKKNENMEKFKLELENKIETLYYDEENDNNEELNNLLDLIKLDDNTDFYKAFENQLSNLINPNENNILFDSVNINDSNILDYIMLYIEKEGIKISNTNKKKKQKKDDKKFKNNVDKVGNIQQINENNTNDIKNNIKEEENIISDISVNKKERKNEANSSDINSSNFFP